MGVNNDFKFFFNEMKSTWQYSPNKNHYKNSLKDLNQTQRTNLIKILNGQLESTSQEAAEIVDSMQNYQKLHGNKDPKGYYTARNPPRKRSWKKTIGRGYHNLGSRVSSDKLIKTILNADLKELKAADNKVMGDWLSKFKDNYLAHAIFTKANNVLEDGVLKPAEMILRENASVEFEMGTTYGQRGTTQLPKLNDNDLKKLESVLFSDADAQRLAEISKDPSLDSGKAKYKEFSRLRKETNQLDEIADPVGAAEMRGKFLKASKSLNDPDVTLYLESVALKRKQQGLRALFTMKDKTSLFLTGPRQDVSAKIDAREVIEQLAKKYKCNERDVLIAFDQRQPIEKQIDPYLRKKFGKGIYPQNMLANIRSDVLRNSKLNQEIRMSEDTIFWSYGNVVILMGGDKSVVRERAGNEALLDSPIKSDDFYSINLKTTDNVLILGPRKELEAFKADYGDRIVYIEDLSPAQRKSLDVPDNLS